MDYKLGKHPAQPGAIKFKLADFVDLGFFPDPPATFGHEELVAPTEWNMFGNDRYGDCFFAGAAHEHLMWSREGGSPAAFSDATVLGDYAACTGFNPADPSTDKGTNVSSAAEYRRTVGMLDVSGKRHKVGAYLALHLQDLKQLYVAMELFGAVGIGIDFPNTAWDQFKNHQSWKVVPGAHSEGGHYVPLVALRGNLVTVTWGRFQAMRLGFYMNQCDEAIAYVSEDALNKDGKSPEGFDQAALIARLEALPTI